jgi:hypothetical protein
MNGYRPRPVTAYGTEMISDWSVKVYGLVACRR